MDRLIGRTLLNRYRVEQRLGGGAMADVYKVWDSARTCWLAIKVLHSGLADSPEFVERFEREAEALRRLDHPNIVRFFGIEREEDVTFLVLEYVEGPTLATRLAHPGGVLPLDEVVSTLQDLCSALAFAHRKGVIHRDVKAGNVLLAPDGHALLSDFNISRLGESPTVTVFPIGTAAYMSPEQCEGKQLDTTSDIYSLGVVLFEMSTGRRPFQGQHGPFQPGSREAICHEHIEVAPTPPSEINPDVPATLERVIMRALAKEPRYRYQRAEDLAAALTEAVPQATVRQLRIDAPQGASVYLDGELRGEGSITIVGVRDGRHRLEVVQDGYQRYVRQVNSPGTRHVEPRLVPSTDAPTALAPSGTREDAAEAGLDGTAAARGWRQYKAGWMVAALVSIIVVAGAAAAASGTVSLPFLDGDPASPPASPDSGQSEITVDEAFDLLPQMVLQTDDLPPGLERFDSSFFSAADIINLAPNQDFARRRVESWGFVLGYFKEYRAASGVGVFDLLDTVWLLEDEQRAESAFLDRALVNDFPGIVETELSDFMGFGDESLAFALNGPAPDSTGAEIQAEGYSVVVRVGRLIAALTMFSPAGQASQPNAGELAGVLFARMNGSAD